MIRRDSRGPGRPTPHHIVPGVTQDRDLAIAWMLANPRPLPTRPQHAKAGDR